MSVFRLFRVATFAWGAYRTFRRYRNVLRSNAKHAVKRARRAI